MEFELPKSDKSIIKVIGVGGGGGNAVNHMYNEGIKGVSFLICNTDKQAIEQSPVPYKLQLGESLTRGMGAGSDPEVGRNAAIDSIDEFKKVLEDDEVKMVFITAGMGGGTGTGAAPELAKVAKEMGVLTVGIVTMPFRFEGRLRISQAKKGVEEMRQNVDTLLIIQNDRLREMYGNLALSETFKHADNVLTTAARGIAEIITRTGYVNVDFNDVSTVMRNSGVAIMGMAVAEGEDRAIKAVEKALASPLLNDNDIHGAKDILLNIEYGSLEVTMDEVSDITDFVQEESGGTANVIWGYGFNEGLGEALSVTVIATGFSKTNEVDETSGEKVARTVHVLKTDEPAEQKPVAPKKETDSPFLKKDVTANEPFLKKEKMPVEEKEYHFDTEQQPENTAPASPEKSDEPFLKPVAETNTGSLFSQPTPGPSMRQPEEKSPEPAPKPEANRQVMPSARVQERIQKLKELNRKLRSPSGLNELEDVPAYKRRQVELEEGTPSTESAASRYSLETNDEDGEKKTGINPDNSFLHDNVD